jgi:hypothetical protein
MLAVCPTIGSSGRLDRRQEGAWERQEAIKAKEWTKRRRMVIVQENGDKNGHFGMAIFELHSTLLIHFGMKFAFHSLW